MEALSTAGRWGSPAPTTISGAPCWESSWQAAQIAETSGGCTSCISSMNRAMPLPTSAASPAASLSSSTRSISMSPESARPLAAGTSMPGCQRSRTLASAADGPLGEGLDRRRGRRRSDSWSGWRQLAQRHVQGRGDRPAQRLVGAGLDLAGAPAPGDRRGAQLVEQHGLADAAQPGEHQRALRPAARDPLEDDVEGRQLGVPAGELGRALAGAGGVGVPDGIHVEHRMAVSSAP